METNEIKKIFIKNLIRKYKNYGIENFTIIKEVEKIKNVFNQISQCFPYLSINGEGNYSRKFNCNIKYGSLVFENCDIEIEIDIRTPTINIFFQFAPVDHLETETYLFSLEDIFKFQLKHNILVLL